MSTNVQNDPASIPAGFRITYAEDDVFPGSFFADLRDGLGRVAESGGGTTQEAARAALMERWGRAESGHRAPLAAAPAPDLGAMLAELIAQGYDVSFTEGFGAEPFGAHVEKSGQPDAGCTALGYTPALALAAALPEAVSESLTALPAPDLATDVRTLSADMADAMERLDALEAERGVTDRDVRTLIHCLADVLAQDNPDGALARKLRKDREEEEEEGAAAGAAASQD